MFNQEFEELLDTAYHDDDIELYQIFLEHKKYRVMLAAAFQVLAKFPKSQPACRGLLLHAMERSNPENRELIQEILNEIEQGFPEIS